MIGAFAPRHVIFRKDYCPPTKHKPKPAFDFLVKNPNGFFDGLSKLPASKLKKRSLAIPKHLRAEQRINYIEHMLEKLSNEKKILRN